MHHATHVRKCCEFRALAGLLVTANDKESEYRPSEIDEMPWDAAPHSGKVSRSGAKERTGAAYWRRGLRYLVAAG